MTRSTTGTNLFITKIEINRTVVDDAIVLENVAALRDFVPTEACTVKVKMNDVKVTYVGLYTDSYGETTDRAVLEDASAGNAFEGYTLGYVLKAGQTLNGELVLDVTLDSWGMPIYTSSLDNVTITDGEPSPLEVTDDNILEYLGDFSWRLVKFSNVTARVDSEYGDVYFQIPVLGEDPIGMMDAWSAIADSDMPADGDVVDVVGYYVDYFGYFQFFQPLSISKVYYLVGNMNDWKANADYKLTKNTAAEVEEYMITLDLAADAQFKVMRANGETEIWYPDGMGNAYGENGELTEAGNYTVYFRPNADGGDDWFYNVIYVAKNTATGVNALGADIANGAVVYNMQGVRVQNVKKGLYIVNGKKVLVK